MALLSEILQQPLDKWNLIGGLLGTIPGIVSMYLVRRIDRDAMKRLQESGASKEEIEAWQKRRDRLKAQLVVLGFVIMPLAGFFLLGPAYRAKLGG